MIRYSIGQAELIQSAVNVPAERCLRRPRRSRVLGLLRGLIILAGHVGEVWAAAIEIETNEMIQRQAIRDENRDDTTVGNREL
jgi:hypothetical protein